MITKKLDREIFCNSTFLIAKITIKRSLFQIRYSSIVGGIHSKNAAVWPLYMHV